MNSLSMDAAGEARLTSALVAVRETLLCSWCGDLPASTASALLGCSHRLCSRHVVEGSNNSCRTCHRLGQAAVPAPLVDEMVSACRVLLDIFNVETATGSGVASASNETPSAKATGRKIKRKSDIAIAELANISNKLYEISADENRTKPFQNLQRENSLKKDDDITMSLKNERPRRERKERNVSDSPQTSTPPERSGTVYDSKITPLQRERLAKKKQSQLSPTYFGTVTNMSRRALDRVALSPSKTKKGTVKITGTDNDINNLKKSYDHTTNTFRNLSHIDAVNTPNATLPIPELIATYSSPGKLRSRPKANNNKKNQKGETALHAACSSGHTEVALRLLQEGADPNTRDHAGWTPLHEAVSSGREELSAALLLHGALPDVPGPDYETPLHDAVRNKYTYLAKLIIEYGGDVYARNAAGITPLQLADNSSKDILAKTQTLSPSNNIVRLSAVKTEEECESLIVYSPSLDEESGRRLKVLSKKHRTLKIEEDFSKDVTHVLVDCAPCKFCRPDRDSLMAAASGKWLISTAWIQACNDSALADIREFEIKSVGGVYSGAENARINRYLQRPGLFDGCSFFFSGLNSKYEISASLTTTLAFLTTLVKAGGGEVLRREPNPEALPERAPWHAASCSPLAHCGHFIIYRDLPALAYNMSHLRSLPVGWLIECVEQFRLVDP